MSYPHLGPLLQILGTIASEDGVDLDRLQEVTGLSHPSLKRQIQAARSHGVVIEWVGSRGGHYEIRSWGVINPAQVKHQSPPAESARQMHG